MSREATRVCATEGEAEGERERGSELQVHVVRQIHMVYS